MSMILLVHYLTITQRGRVIYGLFINELKAGDSRVGTRTRMYGCFVDEVNAEEWCLALILVGGKYITYPCPLYTNT